jgi:hypothetical protein
MSLHRSFVQARLWVALSLGLAAPGALAEMDKCEVQCASEPGRQLQSCLDGCPGARNGGRNEHFQACADRCKAKFDTVYNACGKKCPGHEEPKSNASASKGKGSDHKGKGSDHKGKDKDKRKKRVY